MDILLIFAHPNPKSFCGALKDSFINGVNHNKHSIEVIDLYREKFNPISFGDNEITLEVEKYQQLIKNANCLVFVYPVWWFRAPAILEGWFDRVFTVGFAFDFKKVIGNWGRPIGLLPCDKAIIVNTYGSPALATKYFYMNIPFRRLKRGVLKLCGIKNVRRFNCWSVPFVSDKKRKAYLKRLYGIGQKLG
jgi:NAD(P)H dehydrogenase (quinone)